MIANQTPRPYLGLFKLSNGTTVAARTRAFDLSEAMFQMSIQMSGQGYASPMLVEIGPDVALIEQENKIRQSELAADFISTVMKEVRKP